MNTNPYTSPRNECGGSAGRQREHGCRVTKFMLFGVTTSALAWTSYCLSRFFVPRMGIGDLVVVKYGLNDPQNYWLVLGLVSLVNACLALFALLRGSRVAGIAAAVIAAIPVLSPGFGLGLPLGIPLLFLLLRSDGDKRLRLPVLRYQDPPEVTLDGVVAPASWIRATSWRWYVLCGILGCGAIVHGFWYFISLLQPAIALISPVDRWRSRGSDSTLAGVLLAVACSGLSVGHGAMSYTFVRAIRDRSTLYARTAALIAIFVLPVFVLIAGVIGEISHHHEQFAFLAAMPFFPALLFGTLVLLLVPNAPISDRRYGCAATKSLVALFVVFGSANVAFGVLQLLAAGGLDLIERDALEREPPIAGVYALALVSIAIGIACAFSAGYGLRRGRARPAQFASIAAMACFFMNTAPWGAIIIWPFAVTVFIILQKRDGCARLARPLSTGARIACVADLHGNAIERAGIAGLIDNRAIRTVLVLQICSHMFGFGILMGRFVVWAARYAWSFGVEPWETLEVVGLCFGGLLSLFVIFAAYRGLFHGSYQSAVFAGLWGLLPWLGWYSWLSIPPAIALLLLLRFSKAGLAWRAACAAQQAEISPPARSLLPA